MFRTIKPHKNKLKDSGFTLLELMIAVAIVAILAAIAMPSYIESVQKARRGDAQEALLECAAAQERFFTRSQPSTYMAEADAEAEQVCGWDGTEFISQEGFYELSFVLEGCQAGTRFFCYTIVARAQSGQLNDEECRELSIDARGNRAAEDDTGTLNTTNACWRS